LLASVFVTTIAAGWITEPISQLNRSAKALAAGNLSQRVALDRNDEVGGLAKSFDSMAEQLEKSFTTICQSEDRYHSLFDRSLDGLYLSTYEGRFVDVNPAFVNMMGYSSKQEMLDIKDIKQELYYSPEERDRRWLERRDEKVVEAFRLRRKDGSEIWVEDHGHYILDEHGRMTHREGIIRDVTDRKRIDEALRESEEKYRSFVENANELITVASESGTIVYANSMAEKVTGYSQNELVGKSLLDLLDPQDLDLTINRDGFSWEPESSSAKSVVLRLGSKFEYGKSSQRREYHITTKKGDTKWIEVNGTLIRWMGRPAVLQFSTDITERKRMEEELRKSAQFLSSIIENANVWMDVIDPEGNILIWNKAAEAISGYSTEEVTGKRLVWAWLYPDEEYRKQIMDSSLGAGQEVETRIKRKDGTSRILSWSARQLHDDYGKVVGAIIIGRDATEQKRMEEELRRYSEQLEVLVDSKVKELKEINDRLVKTERLAAIGQMAAMLGHDIRNPLQSILGATDNLEKRVDPANEQANRMLTIIKNSVEYSNEIISDLLDFSREMHLELAKTTPRDLVNETLAQVTLPTEIRFVNLTEGEPILTADRGKMERALRHIIENAIQAMPNGGELAISTKQLGDEVAFTISDTGIGMNESVLGRIFTPLFTTKAKGIGLGLAISKRIVEAHGGSISVRSKAGEGSTFTLRIPLERNQKESEARDV
jgi:PAS domain S-box-containing protein